MKIIISPHIDDAALALGGSLLNWLRAGERVYVLNVFSLCAESYYDTSGLQNEEKTRLRKKEEVRIMQSGDYLGLIFP